MLEHSPLGASGAERWGACPGSTTLINLLRSSAAYVEDDPDFRRDGIQAHSLAALCLTEGKDAWEGLDQFDSLTPAMMAAVQVHIDYVHSRPGAKLIELRMHRPEFHELCYGTTDVAVLDPGRLEVIDYKHGEGIPVEVENNWQTMYYAFMVIDELGEAWKDDEPITLTIVQPRIPWHPDGVIRSWTTTVGCIRSWAYDELRPAMVKTFTDAYLSPGEHCRFCPAKLICPAFLSVANKRRNLSIDDIKNMTDEMVGELLADLPVLSMVIKEAKAEARRRILDKRTTIPGWKIVRAKSDRVWKSGATDALEQQGIDVWQPRKIKSPAMIEDEGHKTLVHEWAFSPDVGYDIVQVKDKRREVTLSSPADWQKFVDNATEKE